MARSELMDTWIVDGDLGDIQAKLRKFLNRRNMKIVEESVHEIHFKQGSQILTRLLGGWFVSPAWLPKTGVLVMKEAKTGVRIQATIEESLGFGVLDPLLKSKYEKYFEQWMNDLKDALD